MNITEASKILGVAEKSVRRYIKRGLIEAKMVEGRNGEEYLIDADSLQAFKSKRFKKTFVPTVESSNTQSGRDLVTMYKGRPLSMDNSPEQEKLDQEKSAWVDIGQGRVVHHKDLRIGEPGQYLDAIPDVLSVQQVAQYLDIGVQTIRDYIKAGKLRSAKMGKGYKISKDSLRAFIKKVLG